MGACSAILKYNLHKSWVYFKVACSFKKVQTLEVTNEEIRVILTI